MELGKKLRRWLSNTIGRISFRNGKGIRADSGRDEGQPSYPDGVPNPDKFGFIPLGVAMARSAEDADSGIQAVAEVLQRPVRYVDDKGYDHEITAGAVDPSKKSVAWIECHCKEKRNGYVDVEFRLKAQIDGTPVIDWVVETYNPYFGCRVGYMAWHAGRVVVIYREKHNTYACSLIPGRLKARVEITDEWLVTSTQVVYRSERRDFVDRLALPDLRRLEAITAAEAREAEVLPPDYDRWNARGAPET